MSSSTDQEQAVARPLRRDAQRNRDRILAAAAEAFAELGVETQMDDVARRAGVGVGTVYRHFPTKDALLAELMRRKFARLLTVVEEALEVEDPWDSFEQMLTRQVETLEEDAVVRDALQRVPQAWATCSAERAEVTELAARVVSRAREAGVLRPDFEVDDIPMLMCGISSAMSMSLLPRRDWRRHLAIVLDGLRVR